MGYVGKLEEKFKAQALRREGLSYGAIIQQIHVSKGTLSDWCRDIELTKEQQLKLIENRLFGQKKGSIIAADNKRRMRFLKTQTIFKEAKKELGKLTKRDKFIIGIALYAGEGDKGDHKGAFTNSNPVFIKFMSDWFKEFCNLPISKLRGAIWLHEGLNERKAKIFWSDLTGIPRSQFHKTYIAKNKVDSKKIRKNIHQYGVFAIRFSSSDVQRRIMGWISAVLDDKIPTVH